MLLTTVTLVSSQLARLIVAFEHWHPRHVTNVSRLVTNCLCTRHCHFGLIFEERWQHLPLLHELKQEGHNTLCRYSCWSLWQADQGAMAPR